VGKKREIKQIFAGFTVTFITFQLTSGSPRKALRNWNVF